MNCPTILQVIDDDIYHSGFHIIDNFLDPTLYHALNLQIKATHIAGQFKSAKVGQASSAAHHPLIRTDHICWLDPHTQDNDLLAFYAAIENVKTTLNRSLFLGLDYFESHFAIYQPGQFYKKHIDQFKTTQDRRISYVYYLNENWQSNHGGELIIYNQDNQLLASVPPIGNRFICFNSELPHEVLKTDETRYSITGWLKIRN